MFYLQVPSGIMTLSTIVMFLRHTGYILSVRRILMCWLMWYVEVGEQQGFYKSLWPLAAARLASNGLFRINHSNTFLGSHRIFVKIWRLALWHLFSELDDGKVLLASNIRMKFFLSSMISQENKYSWHPWDFQILGIGISGDPCVSKPL